MEVNQIDALSITEKALAKLQIGMRPIFIVGNARSGTSWVGNIFSKAKGVLYYPEPCNPSSNKSKASGVWFKYVRKGEDGYYYKKYLDRAFLGLKIQGMKRSGKSYLRLLPGFRIVIKEVASLMCLEWVSDRYDPIILLVIRHPCGVALSQKVKGTQLSKDTIIGEKILEDHLHPYLPIIEKAKTYFELYGVLWAARHRILANWLENHTDWMTVFYEDLCINPGVEFNKLFKTCGLKYSTRVEGIIQKTSTKNLEGIYKTSRLSMNQTFKWKKEMSKVQINEVRRFVEPFELPFYQSEEFWL